MEFRRLVGWAKGHRNTLAVTVLILLFAGVDLLLNAPKDRSEQWFSIPLLAAGFSLLALILWPTAKPGPRAPRDTLAHRILMKATWNGRLIPLFPAFGVLVIVLDLAYNRFASSTPEILEHDLIALLFGAALIAYRFVPETFERERDFVFLFLGVLSLLLVLPLLLVRLIVGDPTESVNLYSSVALAPQTSGVLSLLGVRNTILYDPAGVPGLRFATALGQPIEVYITTACSGIYSFAIFASAFSAFVLTEQRKLTVRVAIFFALGVSFAYVANVLRMVVIVLVGYHFGTPGDAESATQAMLAAHSNAGWMIFLAWVSLFWLVLFRFLPRESPSPSPSSIESAPRRGTFCGICGIVLTPAIPATRCACSRFYHLECLTAEGHCPICSAPSPSSHPAVDHPTA